ncbi:SDR family oxidoreductase [Alphaproteobacteria bacterium]|nr:SDR family oxidoreductase [Alphaproteobacteria bacterium]
MQQLKDKVVVITGGATGIGFAFAKAFGGQGAKIVLGEPRQAALDEAITALTDLGIHAVSMAMDVRHMESVEAFADFAWQQFGRVDILFNNAGVSMPRAPIEQSDMQAVRDLFDVNFFGIWHGCRAFTKRMIAQGTPAEVYNTGSENSLFVAVPHSAAYVASKHAILGLTESLRHDAPDFLHYGVIFPGFVATPMTAAGGGDLGMDADEYAAIVLAQVQAGEAYIVSHAYNAERIAPRTEALQQAYAKYAPRYPGDDVYDVPLLIERWTKARSQKDLQPKD